LRRRVRLAAAFLVAAWLTASALLFVWPRQDRPKRADAVIVLSGSHSRLDTGLRLMRHGVAPTLVISDGMERGWVRANRLCEGRARLRVICFRPSPYSTRGEARAVARMAARRHWRTLVVVTSTFHVTRARMLFRRCTSARIEAVGSKPAVISYAENVPYETAKLLYQVTVSRSC